MAPFSETVTVTVYNAAVFTEATKKCFRVGFSKVH